MLIQVAFARQNLQHRIVTQLLMIVQVLVAERQRTNTLRHHFRHRMPHQPGVAAIEKTFCQPGQQIQTSVRFPQQQASGIAGHGPGFK